MYLVIGATGNVGREIVVELATRREAVRALTREPAQASFPDGVEVVTGDLTIADTLVPVMRGVDAVYTPMRPGTAGNLARAAVAAGVDRIVLLTSLAVQSGSANPLAQTHLQAEAAVRDSGLGWTFVRPTAFASNTLAWAPSIASDSVVRAPFGRLRAAVVDPRDIAEVAVAALLGSDYDRQALPLTGPEPISVTEQVRAISDLLGRDVVFIEQSEDEARAEMLSRMPAPVIDALLAAQRAAVAAEPIVHDTVIRVTGHAPRTYRQWLTDHLELFT